MDYRCNFGINCSFEEANKIAGFSALDIATIVEQCYNIEYLNKISKGTHWAHFRALLSVYVLGYLSGCRTTREKHKAKN